MEKNRLPSILMRILKSQKNHWNLLCLLVDYHEQEQQFFKSKLETFTQLLISTSLFGSDVYSRSAIMFEISHMVNPYPPATSKEALKNDPRLAEVCYIYVNTNLFSA